MANDLLSAFLARAALQITEMTPGDAGIVRAKNLKVKRASIRFESRLMRHMLEDGSTIADARVRLPTEVTLDTICPTLDDLSQVNQILANRTATYNIFSRGIRVSSLAVIGHDIDQAPDNTSSIPVRIQMKEVMIQSDPSPIQEQAADSSLVNRGRAILSEVQDSIKDKFDSVLKNAKTAAGQVQGIFGG